MGDTPVHRRLNRFYDEFTSVDAILRALAREAGSGHSHGRGPVHALPGLPEPRRFTLLSAMPPWWRSIRPSEEGQRVLDAGCGLGGPAAIWLTGLGAPSPAWICSRRGCRPRPPLPSWWPRRPCAYCQVDATHLPFASPRFGQAWMLDVPSISPTRQPLGSWRGWCCWRPPGAP